MEKPRNKARAPGMGFLGIPMPETTKEKIRQAAEIDQRTMADWARIELKRAAEAVIAAHHHGGEQTHHPPLAMVAETHEKAPPQSKKQVRYPKALKHPDKKTARQKQA